MSNEIHGPLPPLGAIRLPVDEIRRQLQRALATGHELPQHVWDELEGILVREAGRRGERTV